jgi:hypothetical protein
MNICYQATSKSHKLSLSRNRDSGRDSKSFNSLLIAILCIRCHVFLRSLFYSLDEMIFVVDGFIIIFVVATVVASVAEIFF